MEDNKIVEDKHIQTLEEENNCFLPLEVTGDGNTLDPQNELMLYNEADPLAYICSRASMPLKNAANDSHTSPLEDIDNLIPEKMLPKSNYSEYNSLASSINIDNSAGENVEWGANEIKDSVTDRIVDLKSAILGKINEFSAKVKKFQHMEYFNTFKKKHTHVGPSNLQVQELFLRKEPFSVSSSESNQSQYLSEKQFEEVFSTGASDSDTKPDELNSKHAKNDITKTARRIRRAPNKKTTATKKLIKRPNQKSDFQQVSSETMAVDLASKNNTHCPKGRNDYTMSFSSLKRVSTNKRIRTSLLFVEEIKRNNLMMKEEIFSSSKAKDGISDCSSNSEINCEEKGKSVGKLHRKFNNFSRRTKKNSDFQVFETRGSNRLKGKTFIPSQETKLNSTEVYEMPRMNKLEIQDKVRFSRKEQSTLITFDMEEEQEVSDYETNSFLPSNIYRKQLHEERTVLTPLNKSKYVKLPGLENIQNTQEICIKDGTSFESTCLIKSDSESPRSIPKKGYRTKASQQHRSENEVCRKNTLKMDASTDVQVPIRDQFTQTNGFLLNKSTADSSVQCKKVFSNDSPDPKNEHQEIMISDDDGNGVQLYNVLGHPLTDMEGYLLKDSHGRYLVHLDHFGTPTSCTNGDKIFMENGAEWNLVKGCFTIVHRQSKVGMKKSNNGRVRYKCRHQLFQKPENLIRNRGKSHLFPGVLNHITNQKNTTIKKYMYKRSFEINGPLNPLQKLKHKSFSTDIFGNPASLIAEMQSIAKLRNTLMDKINLMVDNRNLHDIGEFPSKMNNRDNTTLEKDMLSTNSIVPSSRNGIVANYNENRRQFGSYNSCLGNEQRKHENLYQGTASTQYSSDSSRPRFTSKKYFKGSKKNVDDQPTQKPYLSNQILLNDTFLAPQFNHSWQSPLESNVTQSFQCNYGELRNKLSSTSLDYLTIDKSHHWNALKPCIEIDSDEGIYF